MRNFGHDGPENFFGLGINGKNSEFHAAMGLANLRYIDDIIEKRKKISEHYKIKLKTLKIRYPMLPEELEYNYAYFPVLFETEDQLLKSLERLNLSNISTRRYFYPALNQLPYVIKQSMPITENIARRVLCPPLYHTLSIEETDMICRLLLRVQNFGG